MFRDALMRVDQQQAKALIEEINQDLGAEGFDPDKAILLGQDIPFYSGYKFFEIVDYDTVPNRHRFVVYKPDERHVLDWSNETIYKLNEIVPITLTEKNVADYARFFFTYVRGRHGRFLLINTVDDIDWREEPPPAARKAISNLIHPIKILDQDENGYTLESCIIFKDGLFKAKISVTNQGEVSLFDETLLIEEMPLLDDIFGQ